MKMKTVSGATMAAAAASLLISGAVMAPTSAGAAGKVPCMGASACKGQGACKTNSNACKGQNACKGKGLGMVSSKAACKKMGGTVQG